MMVMQHVGGGAPDGRARTVATSKEKALWLLEKLVPESGLNNVSFAFQVAGRLNSGALESAIAVVLRRYETLRTVFIANDAELVKEVIPAAEFKVAVEQSEISGDDVGAGLTEFIGRPFDLDGQPLFRAGVFAHADGDVFCMAVHHLVFDAISIGIFMQAFVPVYDALAAGRPLPAEASAEVPAYREPEPGAADVAFWRERLAGYVPDGLELWCGSQDLRRPSMTGASVTHTVSEETRDAVARLRREVRAPEAAILLAGYFILLASHGAGPDLVVGSPVDVRPPEAASAIGYHVNVVPLRLRVDLNEDFRSFVRSARDMFLGAMGHANASVDDVSAELPRFGSSWRDMLYRHMFNYFPGLDAGDFTFGGMPARHLEAENGYSKFDLEFFVMAAPSELRLRAGYYTEVLGRADVEALLRRYEAILLAAAEDPDRPLGEVAALSTADRAVVDEANRTDRPVEPATVLDAIRSHVSVAPDAPAVVDGDDVVSYERLWHDAACVRALLDGTGVQAGDVVAVVARRGDEAVTGLVGAWRAGAVGLPLDPEDPKLSERITGAEARAVLAGRGVRVPGDDTLPSVHALDAVAGEPGNDTGEASDPGSPACLLYPAGTVLSHRGIANLVAYFAAELSAGPADTVLALADPGSPGSLLELLLPLSTGGRIVVAPDEARTDAAVLRALRDRHALGSAGILQVPSGMSPRVLDESADALAGLRVIAGGEPLPPEVARRLLAAGCALYGVAGTAETTGWFLAGQIDGDEAAQGLVRGRPVANARAFVVAPDGRELPPGVRGELCVAGDVLALDAERAFPHHERYGRHHRTGLLARRDADGAIECLGRIDRQVVIAGSQVNLAEIESVLLDHSGVYAAAALMVPDTDGEDTLVAFAETGVPAGDLREHASARLRAAAVPEHLACLDALPRTGDRRIDHDALVTLGAELQRRAAAQEAPPADEELVRKLIALWGALLKLEATDQTNFFAEGGYSLLAAKLAQDIEEFTGVRLELPEIFTYPTPAALAARVSEIGV
jgi:non-ribosomal peptide synthetase component F